MSRPLVKLDTETKSGKDLKKVGRHSYLRDPDAGLICMSYKINENPTRLWAPGMPLPYCFKNTKDWNYAAFNMQFDHAALKILGVEHGVSEIPLSHCVDVMAIAARYGLPQSLDGLGKMLKVEMPKFKTGGDLKKVICMPPFKYTREQLRSFYEYCIRDTDCMVEIMKKLPMDKLSASEQHIWQVTVAINQDGLPIDTPAVARIVEVTDFHRKKETKKLAIITDGKVTTAGQTQRMRDFCEDYGVELPNMQKQTLKDVLKRNDLHTNVRKLLQLRLELGGAAVKKFFKLRDMVFEGRIYDNLRYHGASTGRTTGMGFQLLNLPRAKVVYRKEVMSYDQACEALIDKFFDATILKDADPLEEAKKLVRPMIFTPDGKILMDADWSSIEYILLMWFAGEHEKVKRFAQGYDPYIDFATKLFGVKYDDVTGDMRQKAKPPVLGSGYMLGWRKLIEYSEGMEIPMSEEEAQFATGTYRHDQPLVVKSWYALKDCAHRAVKYPGTPFTTHKTTFIVQNDRTGRTWLTMKLPSGRSLFYCQPKIVEGQYGDTIAHMGINSKTKQWGKIYLNPQRTIENAIQSLGRDILNHGLDNVIQAGFNPIAHIYDQIICEEPAKNAVQRYDEMIRLMCLPPSWAAGLPLFASGYMGRRFRK